MKKTVKTTKETVYTLAEKDLVKLIVGSDDLPGKYFIRVERVEVVTGNFELCVELVVREQLQ